MTYSLTNKCAKNYYNRALIVQVIAENVVTCFFFETQCSILVYICKCLRSWLCPWFPKRGDYLSNTLQQTLASETRRDIKELQLLMVLLN